MSTDALVRAIQAGDEQAFTELLRDDPAAAKGRTVAGESPLLMALYVGRRAWAEAIATAGRALDGWEAAALGDADRLRAALEADPSLRSAQTHDGWTALHYAAFFGHGEALRTLVDGGADVNAVSGNGMRNTPLHAAAAGPLPIDAFTALLDAGADANARQQGGFVPLHAVAQSGDVARIEALLRAGADVDAATDDGRTALDLAREKGWAEAEALLVARGADGGATNGA